MKTDLKSIATQLRTFFRTSRYEVYFKKCEADTLSASRNLLLRSGTEQLRKSVLSIERIFCHMLEELYRDLRDELIRWCTTMTQDRSTAEDLVQEAFWKAINNEAMLQTMTPPQRRAWLYQVVKNLFIDRTRHAAYEAVMEELPETAGDELPSEYDSLLSQDLLRRLPEDERVLFVLRYIEGYNSTELGKLFSLSPGAVRAKRFSARQHLKKELED